MLYCKALAEFQIQNYPTSIDHKHIADWDG